MKKIIPWGIAAAAAALMLLLTAAGEKAAGTTPGRGGRMARQPEQKNLSWEGLDVLPEDARVDYPVQLSENQWRRELTELQYHILREKGTERAFSGDLYDEHRRGVYYSAATGQPLFSSDTKFESGTGWPSFLAPIDQEAVVLKQDNSLFASRVEVVDSSSGSHLGHVFNDGPEPTGLRYCINSASLLFVPEGSEPPRLVKEYRERFGT